MIFALTVLGDWKFEEFRASIDTGSLVLQRATVLKSYPSQAFIHAPDWPGLSGLLVNDKEIDKHHPANQKGKKKVILRNKAAN